MWTLFFILALIFGALLIAGLLKAASKVRECEENLDDRFKRQ